MDHTLSSVVWSLAFVLCASAFAYLRRFIADVISDLVYQTNPVKIALRIVVLIGAMILAILFGASLVALLLGAVRFAIESS